MLNHPIGDLVSQYFQWLCVSVWFGDNSILPQYQWDFGWVSPDQMSPTCEKKLSRFTFIFSDWGWFWSWHWYGEILQYQMQVLWIGSKCCGPCSNCQGPEDAWGRAYCHSRCAFAKRICWGGKLIIIFTVAKTYIFYLRPRFFDSLFLGTFSKVI